MPSSAERIAQALDRLHIELPSWGFANTGTRFGKFLQPAAAVTTAEKIADAGFVHQLTGSCPAVALHVLWDFPGGMTMRWSAVAPAHGAEDRARSTRTCFRIRSTSTARSATRRPPCARALAHCRDSVQIAQRRREP